jgi:hypothetical protein
LLLHDVRDYPLSNFRNDLYIKNQLTKPSDKYNVKLVSKTEIPRRLEAIRYFVYLMKDQKI